MGFVKILLSCVALASIVCGIPVHSHLNVVKVLGDNSSLIEIGEVNGKSFYTGKDTMTWFEANEYCQRLNLHWGKIENVEENDLISRYTIITGNSMWLSATRTNREGGWEWAEDHSKLNYHNWFPIDPHPWANYAILFDFRNSGVWWNTDWDLQYYPLCYAVNDANLHSSN